ncbi:MAG: hypothetical protein IT204_06210 [Fimbriimonadaceae bacterium]|nr:hypothetical protein [Fimbriimonadaceae bacterium]
MADGKPEQVSQLEFGPAPAGDDPISGKVTMVDQLGERAGVVRELFGFLWANKLWWMIPMVGVLLVFGILMLLASSSPAGAFIYTLF